MKYAKLSFIRASAIEVPHPLPTLLPPPQTLLEASQKLYVRLFLRNHRWFKASKLSYPKIVHDLQPVLEDLISAHFLLDGRWFPALYMHTHMHHRQMVRDHFYGHDHLRLLLHHAVLILALGHSMTTQNVCSH